MNATLERKSCLNVLGKYGQKSRTRKFFISTKMKFYILFTRLPQIQLSGYEKKGTNHKFSSQSIVFILSFFSLYSCGFLNDLGLKAFHSPSGRNSFTKLTGLFSLYLRCKKKKKRVKRKKKHKTNGLADIGIKFCYKFGMPSYY